MKSVLPEPPLVADVETLLIHAHQPACKAMGKGILKNTGLGIHNTCRMGHCCRIGRSLQFLTCFAVVQQARAA
jgi:hypothetical protein